MCVALALTVTYPEVNVEVASTAKLAVANLVGDSHLVVTVKLLEEALAAVGGQLDVVGSDGLDERGGGGQQAIEKTGHYGCVRVAEKEQ